MSGSNFRASQHDVVDGLLPWYVNGTLSTEERQDVHRHIAECEECRANVEFFGTVQGAARADDPAPLVPRPEPDRLLAQLPRTPAGGISRWSYAIAASFLAIAVVSVAVWIQASRPSDVPERFETVISPTAPTSMVYVVELQVVESASSVQLEELLATLADTASVEAADTGIIRMRIRSNSFPELQDRIDTLRAMPQVSAAKVVAVQVPVE